MDNNTYNTGLVYAQKKHTPAGLYVLGLLCIIPIIGVIVGIVLIVLGAAYYKNKILIVIGSIGVLVTVGLYSYLFHLAAHIDTKVFAPIAQSQLNELAKDIEFYKLQNGQYPEKLKQAIGNNKMISVYDIMYSTRKLNIGDRQYHYQKIGEQYTLFSVGRDAMPYTADDIYPDLQIKDSSKFGLIRVTHP